MTSGTVPIREFQERSFSLTDTLRSVASGFDSPPVREHLHAALGLPFMICTPHDPSIPPRDWPLLARDVFLIETARLFGLTIRDIHPPEAAVGLQRMQVFRQHFAASYRPLVLRAMENGQHVLAWQGWPGADYNLWGRVGSAGVDDGELGICGITGADLRVGGDTAPTVPMVAPPVQLYVIETISISTPDANALWQLVRQHARRALNNECATQLGILTGPPAVDAWKTRLSKSSLKNGDTERTLDDDRKCAGEYAAGLSAIICYARSAWDGIPEAERSTLRAVSAASHKAMTAFASIANAPSADGERDLHHARELVLAQLAGARSALAEAADTLSS